MRQSQLELKELVDLVRSLGEDPGLVPVGGVRDGRVEAGVGGGELGPGGGGDQPPVLGGEEEPGGGQQQDVWG